MGRLWSERLYMDRAADDGTAALTASAAGATFRVNGHAAIIKLRRVYQARLHTHQALDVLIPREAHRAVYSGETNLEIFRLGGPNRADRAHLGA